MVDFGVENKFGEGREGRGLWLLLFCVFLWLGVELVFVVCWVYEWCGVVFDLFVVILFFICFFL